MKYIHSMSLSSSQPRDEASSRSSVMVGVETVGVSFVVVEGDGIAQM